MEMHSDGWRGCMHSVFSQTQWEGISTWLGSNSCIMCSFSKTAACRLARLCIAAVHSEGMHRCSPLLLLLTARWNCMRHNVQTNTDNGMVKFQHESQQQEHLPRVTRRTHTNSTNWNHLSLNYSNQTPWVGGTGHLHISPSVVFSKVEPEIV